MCYATGDFSVYLKARSMFFSFRNTFFVMRKIFYNKKEVGIMS